MDGIDGGGQTPDAEGRYVLGVRRGSYLGRYSIEAPGVYKEGRAPKVVSSKNMILV